MGKDQLWKADQIRMKIEKRLMWQSHETNNFLDVYKLKLTVPYRTGIGTISTVYNEEFISIQHVFSCF